MKHMTKPHTLAEIGMHVYDSELIVEKLMERDYFLDAEQALELGLVDKVLTTREEQQQAMAPLKGYKGDKSNEGNDAKGRGGGEDGQPPSPSVNLSP